MLDVADLVSVDVVHRVVRHSGNLPLGDHLGLLPLALFRVTRRKT